MFYTNQSSCNEVEVEVIEYRETSGNLTKFYDLVFAKSIIWHCDLLHVSKTPVDKFDLANLSKISHY